MRAHGLAEGAEKRRVSHKSNKMLNAIIEKPTRVRERAYVGHTKNKRFSGNDITDKQFAFASGCAKRRRKNEETVECTPYRLHPSNEM